MDFYKNYQKVSWGGVMRIGWIGAGVMGRAMCGHVLRAGHEVLLFTRTPSSAAALLEAGAVWCDSPAAVARASEVVVSIVGYPHDVRSIYFGSEGILEHAAPGAVVVDMTTSSPSLAQEIAAAATKRGIAALDAPVSGGDVGARNGTLAIMVGGDAAVLERVRPVLACMGSTIRHMGPAGAGQHTKMCNQILIAGTMIGMVESLLYAMAAGLDVKEVVAVIGSGAAGCWSVNNLGPRIAQGDFTPGFYIKHFVKDMGIALEECRRMGLCVPGLAVVEQLYQAAIAQGYENLGTQALYKVLLNMSGRMRGDRGV